MQLTHYIPSVRDNFDCHAPEGHRDDVSAAFQARPVPAVLAQAG